MGHLVEESQHTLASSIPGICTVKGSQAEVGGNSLYGWEVDSSTIVVFNFKKEETSLKCKDEFKKKKARTRKPRG